MSIQAVIEIARGELGEHENPPGSNRVKYWDLFGPEWQGQPWCCAFLAWVFNTAGERMAFFGGGKTASCSVLLRWYKEQGLTVDVEDVRQGDIVILNFHGKKDPEHCGLVVDADGTYVATIEGNTTNTDKNTSNDSNGGSVAWKRRFLSQIVGVCRPQYKTDDPQPVDDVSGHWYTPSVEWAREKGLIKNYPDGSFKPNNPLTRAEACAILERFYELLWENDMR